MQLCLRGQKTHIINCDGNETISQLKGNIAGLEKLKPEEIFLYAGGHPVNDADLVSLFQCTDIEITVGLLGGKVHGSLARAVPVPSKPRRAKQTIFSRMEIIKGPLQLLRKCVEEKIRIKVWTRNAHTVRGYCIAYVNAFDKHWNLALSQITEVWTRPAKRKTVAIDAGSSYQPSRKVRPPPITILKATKKEELCSRKVDQYILRGEHVVLIQVYDEQKRKI